MDKKNRIIFILTATAITLIVIFILDPNARATVTNGITNIFTTGNN